MQALRTINDMSSNSRPTTLIFSILLLIFTIIIILSLFQLVISNHKKNEQLQEIESLLNQAYLAEERQNNNDWYDFRPFTTPEAQRIAQQALSNIKYIASQAPKDVEIYRRLGRIALLAGSPNDAVGAFSRAIQLRADSPLIWFELGSAYNSLAPSPSNHVMALLESPFPTASHIEWQWLSTTPVTYRWSLPTASETTPLWWTPAEPMTRTVVQGRQLLLRVSLPVTPTELIFWMGSDYSAPEETITYQVLINNNEQSIGSFTLSNPSSWHLARVDMSMWSGQTIILTLNASKPQAGWGDIAFVSTDEAACRAVDCQQRAVAAWKKGGFAVGGMLRAGEMAFSSKQFDKALTWYEQSLLFNENRSDILYNIGRVFEEKKQWLQALEAYHQAISLGQFRLMPLSVVYFRIGEINQRQLESPNYDLALQAYYQALFHNDFRNDQERAQCYYRIGETLWWQRKVDQAIASLEQAITLNPRHDWAYIRLGTAYYVRTQDLQQSEQALLQAIMLSPQNKWAYYHLGEIYQQAGNLDQAIAMYQKTLEIDSQFVPAIEKLLSIGK